MAKEVEIILNFSDHFRRLSRKQKETFNFIKNRQLIIALFCILTVATILGITSSINTLAVSIDGKQKILKSIDDDMHSLAKSSGFYWNWHDNVSESKEGQNYQINVESTFSVTLVADGNEYIKWVTGGTVDDILTEYGIIINTEDAMNYRHGDLLFSDMVINISRVLFKEYTETQEIPFSSETIEVVLSPNKPAPENVPGQNGVKLITKRDTLVDGIITGTQIVNETVEKEPINAINYIIKKPVIPNINAVTPTASTTIFGEVVDTTNPNFKYKRILKYTSTAYSGDANSGGPRAANGEWLKPGSCAIDKRYNKDLKIGDKLYVTSADGKYVYGYAQVNDYGGTNLANWIDLYIPNEAACNNWGRRDVIIYVLN